MDALNAVAPDWNLKIDVEVKAGPWGSNAVAPDWNLKYDVWKEKGLLRIMQSHQIGI